MSIIVGKRNFTESFSKMTVSDFSRDNIYRAKLIMNENTMQNRNICNQSYLLENARTLKQLFQNVDEKEILTVLDDCDNNMEIAMEILQRSPQPPSMTVVSNEVRNVRKISAPQESRKVENQRSKKEEERKFEPIQEEEPSSSLKIEEVQNLSENIVNTLQNLNSMDEAKDMIAQVIFQVINEAEKKDVGTIRKLNKDKATLITAFANQRVKAQAHEEKNELMSILKNSQEQEIAKLKTINYRLALRLRTLDSNNEENHNFDVC